MSDTRRCRLVNSGDTGYGAIMSGHWVCERNEPEAPEQSPPAAPPVPNETSRAPDRSMYEYYGMTGIGGMFVSMLWRCTEDDGR